MKKEFYAHPLMVLTFFKRYLFILLLPLFNMLLNFLRDRKITGSLLAETVIFCVCLGISVARYRNLKIKICDSGIEIWRGVLFKKRRLINFSAVSSLTLRQNLLEKPLNCAVVSFSTEGCFRFEKEEELRIKYSDAETIKGMVFGSENCPAVKFSVGRLAVSALLTSSAVAGILAGIPFVNNLGKIFGMALSEALFDEINTVSSRFNTYFPPIFNTFIIVLLLGLAYSFACAFLRVLNFRLFVGKKLIEVHSGFFTRRKTVFNKENIRCVSVERRIPLYPLKRYIVKATIGGYGQKRGPHPSIVPALRRGELKELKKLHIPDFVTDGTVIRPAKNRKTFWRFLRPPILVALEFLTAVFITILMFPQIEYILMIASVPVLPVILYIILYFYLNYRREQMSIGKNMYIKSATLTSVRQMYFSSDNIASVKIIRGYFARRKGFCTVKTTLFAGNYLKSRVWHLDYKQTTEKFAELFANSVEQ